MSFRNYYDTSSYSRNRDSGRGSTSNVTDRPTSVTAKYISSTPSYKSSSIPVLSGRDETPISTIANRYAKYDKKDPSKNDKSTTKYDKKDYNIIGKSDKPASKYDKKDYSLLSMPSLNKSRDVSPVSTASKYSIGRTSRHLSPDRKTAKSFKDKSRDPSPVDRDKDIPNKTDKSSGYNLSTYKLYPRASSYTRSSKVDTKPEITVNRYAIANRLSNNYLRSPTPVKRSSVSPVNHLDTSKNYLEKSISPTIIIEEPNCKISSTEQKSASNNIEHVVENDSAQETETITIITRHTSPTPPGSSAYVRNRRADMAKTIEKTITRVKNRSQMVDKEIQSDRLDDPTRSGRYSSMARTNMSNWSYYTPSSTNYTGYAGRYSTQYSNPREGSLGHYSDRSSRSRSTEPAPVPENIDSYSETIRNKELSQQTVNLSAETKPEIVAVYQQNNDNDTSEIVINVNLKLKKTKSSTLNTTAELVSPEVTISNSQLPPQAPKPEGTPKVKKVKVRKSSDSASDSSSKRKVIKKRSKSVSSTDSDQASEKGEKGKESASKKSSSITSLPNGTTKSKHSNTRDSKSPDSSITLSTQSSISEDETISKSKTVDVSRTSADEISLPTDRSAKQSSPFKNETEDAKSFLIRALAPVTNLFKTRHTDSSENNRWPDSSSESTSKDVSNIVTESDRSKSKSGTNNIIASNNDNLVKLKSIRPIESGERPWWIESESEKNLNTDSLPQSSEKNVNRKIRHIESGEKAWWMESNSENEKSGNNIPTQSTTESSDHSKAVKLYKYEEEKPWWLDSTANIPEGIERLTPPRKSSSDREKSSNNVSTQSTTQSSDHNRPVKLYKYDEEKPWWLDSTANIPEGIERLTPPRKSSSESDKSEKYNFFKVRHIESGEKKDWWITSNENSSSNTKSESQSNLNRSGSDKNFNLRRIRPVDSGDRPWWLCADSNIPEDIEKLPTPPTQQESDSSDSEEVQAYVPAGQIPPFPLNLPYDEPLGDRRSPEGLETPRETEYYQGRTSPYENNRQYRRHSSTNGQLKRQKYISRYTDIDDILGTSGQMYSPFMESILARRTGQLSVDDDECEEIDPTQVRIHDSTAQMPVIKKLRCRSEIIDYRDGDQLDDATLQVFKDGDYGAYLDLDSTLGEQDEELEGLQDSRKNALVLRTQLSVRVHAIIERLLHSQGRELRRALFTLKQILQSDKDLVHEFIANKGLDCLMQVSQMSDQNYLDYILRALGQILLYVDGMHGVMAHKPCLQWLYTLIATKYRHIVKTALKLLVVFVEYTEKNSLLLVDAINTVDCANGRLPWHNIMRILQDFDASDTELLIYATTVINRCLNNLPDRDMYYDQVDSLQDQGMDDIIQRYMSKQGTDLDLLRQLQIFDAVLNFEDGDESGTALKQLDESIINCVRRRSVNLNTSERRKSKKDHMKEKAESPVKSPLQSPKIIISPEPEPESKLTNNLRQQILPSFIDNKENKEFTTALRRRRDRFARQAHHIVQQQELLNNGNNIYNGIFGKTNGSLTNGTFTNATQTNGTYTNGINSHCNNGTFISTNGIYPTTKPTYPAVNGKHSCTNASYINGNGVYNINGNYTNTNGNYVNGNYRNLNGDTPKEPPDDEIDCAVKPVKNFNLTEVIINGSQRYTAGLKQRIQNGTLGHTVNAVDALTVMRQKQLDGTEGREHSIKDLAQRLTSPVSPTTEDKPLRVSDMAGIVSKAKEELAKSQSKEIIKSPTIEKAPKVLEIKVSENDLHWEELKKGCLNRAYHLCDLDFSDLQFDSDDDAVFPAVNAANGPPPPPPSMFPPMNAPPPLPTGFPPPIPKNNIPAPPPKPTLTADLSNDSDSSTIKKNKKTVKLFWREIQENPVPVTARSRSGLIWDDLPEIKLDTNMLEHLFESRTNDLIIKKLMEPKRNLILDAKRSNAINIAMKKLPTPQTIKAAIMKMDATVIGREGIEKLLCMLPTEEEKIKIQEAQYANPDLPLGSAEQFLLTLASINELSSRLKLWVFKWDFDNLEKEIAEPLMDLKQGIELLKANKTFKVILSTLRSVGSFLNGSQVKGFRLEYLSKVMEVKDTVHKHPLLYHICEMIIEKFPDSTDFFSEVGPVIRASKVDFDMQSANLQKLETDCKASWDHMKRIAKHDGSQIFKTKINEFLTDAAERIILLSIIKRRVMNRFNKFLLYLGIPPGDVSKTKPSELLKVIAEFALEYRTTRERVLQQLEKRANHRERNKTRGKMIIDVGNFSHKNGDNTADHALKELLKTDPDPDSLTEGRRQRLSSNKNLIVNGDLSAEDAIMESLARSSTPRRRPAPRRRRALPEHNHLNRTLDGQS